MSEPVVIGNATLYCGDCIEILPTLARVDAVVTDPPYGTGWVRGGRAVGVFEAKHEKPAWDVFDCSWMDMAKARFLAAFCASSYLDKMCERFLAPCIASYRKTNVRPGGKDREWCVANKPWAAMEWIITAYNGDCEFHPTQKPLSVMEWCVRHAPNRPQIILDPFMGSGTTGVACMNLGRKFIGIEIERKYFDIACERIDQAQRQQRLCP